MNEKIYEIELCRFEADEDVSGTWVFANRKEMLTIIGIFADTHKVTIREVSSEEE